ncbi:hypothetical protein [Frateuria defendens]|uniref:hypothetical protein n=1 Tax=Frateuria defendens TaxID=2219559 RepID=UPI0012933353|nr:hypothetical protein [Frateuria defendens]
MAVLNVTAQCMTEIMEDLQACGVMPVQSTINFMDDGPHGATWSIIERLFGPDNRKVVQ